MSIVLGRIDYRLLHGIVATMWAPQSGAQRVMVIDDKVANDPVIKESMRLGKPAGMACSIIHWKPLLKILKLENTMAIKCLWFVKNQKQCLHWKKKLDRKFLEL